MAPAFFPGCKTLVFSALLLGVNGEDWKPGRSQVVWKKLENTLCCAKYPEEDFYKDNDFPWWVSEAKWSDKEYCAQECDAAYNNMVNNGEPLTCDEWLAKDYPGVQKEHQDALRRTGCRDGKRHPNYNCDTLAIGDHDRGDERPTRCQICKGGKEFPREGSTCYKRTEECLPYWSGTSSSMYGACNFFEYDTFCEDQAANGGMPCLPGLGILGKGFSIIEDNTDADKLPQLNRPLILPQTFASRKKTITGTQYLMTQEATVTAINTVSSDSSEMTISSLDEFTRQRSADLKIEGSYGIKSGSAAIEGGDSIKTSLAQNMQVTEQSMKYPKYSIRGYPTEGGSPQFNAFLSGFDENSATPAQLKAKARQFVERFGTHMITEVTMGARLSTQTKSDACLSKNEAATNAKAEACAAYEGAGSVSGCASGSQDTSSNTGSSASSTSCTLKVEGGDTSVCSAGSCRGAKCDNDAWAASIGKDRHQFVPLSFQLTAATQIARDLQKGKDTPLWVAIDEFVREKLAAKPAPSTVKAVCKTAEGGGDTMEIAHAYAHEPLWALVAAVGGYLLWL